MTAQSPGEVCTGGGPGALVNGTRGTADFLVQNGLMPPVIIVGVTNTDRTRDLSPTNASLGLSTAANVTISDDDPLFKAPFSFPNGIPAPWPHDGKEARGIKHNGRWVVIYSHCGLLKTVLEACLN